MRRFAHVPIWIGNSKRAQCSYGYTLMAVRVRGTFQYEILVPRIRLEPVVGRIAIGNVRLHFNCCPSEAAPSHARPVTDPRPSAQSKAGFSAGEIS